MWSLALAALLIAPTDTVTVRSGDVLVVERLMGELIIEGSSDDLLSVLTDNTDAGFDFERRGDEIHLRATRGRRMDGTIALRVPERTRIRVSGSDLDVEISGMHGGVSVETLDGDVELSRISGEMSIFTLDGDLSLREGQGAAHLSTLDGEIDVTGFSGNLRAETTDGDVFLRGLDAPVVHANTLDGDVHFDGTVGPKTMLTLVTHSGDVELVLPADLSAVFEVSTVDGNFESDFPVRVRGLEAREALRFSLGDGQAQILIQNFDGDIRLRRR